MFYRARALRVLSLIALFGSPAYGAPFDVDGDGKGELARFRDGTFYLASSTGSTSTVACGASGDIPVPGKYVPGTAAQAAVFNPSNGGWQVCTSGGASRGWGIPGDLPVPGDYNGDGLNDFAIYRPSTGEWAIVTNPAGGAAENPTAISLGARGDIPVPGDYDDDGKTDAAVFRRDASGVTRWVGQFSSGGSFSEEWGLNGDFPVPADYNGDGKTDLAVWRRQEGTWYLSLNGTLRVEPFGLEGDVPSPTDYDGDGKVDLVVYRPQDGKWYVLTQTGDRSVVAGGAPGDRVANHTFAALIDRRAVGDLDGDRVTDLSVVRLAKNNGLQFLFNSASATAHPTPSVNFGKKGDRVGFGDYDGNGLSDLTTITIEKGVAIWRLRLTRGGGAKPVDLVLPWGVNGDDFVAADFDGDRRTDLAAVHKRDDGSREWQLKLTGNQISPPIIWGAEGDTPLSGDVDGDGRSDFVMVRTVGTELLWLVRTASAEVRAPKLFGLAQDRPVVGDFDGDGDAEFAVVRATGEKPQLIVDGGDSFEWGAKGDQSLFGNHGGLFGVGIANWRVTNGQGVFAIRNRVGGESNRAFGVNGDRPMDPIRFIGTSDLKAPSSSSTPAPTNNDGKASSGTGKRLNCASQSSASGQGSGFVWKPKSERSGNLAVLFPRSFAGKIKRAALVERLENGDRVIETLKFRSLTNGGRPTFDGKRSGGSYPDNVVLVRQARNNSYACITVPDPGKRYWK